MNSILSIIIPHYNSLETLPKLVTSIPKIDEIEIIIVDDGSDFSIDYIKEYLEPFSEDRNVTLIKNETGIKGPGGARNQGILSANGKWLLFADSDDSFVGNWYEKISKYFEMDADIVYFCPTGINAETGKTSTRHLRYVDVVEKCANKPSKKTETEMKFSFCTPWSKLFRASLIKENNIRFGEMMVSEDVYFTVQAAMNARSVIADKSVIYCVTRSSGTLSSTKREADYDTRIDVLIWRYNYLKDNLSKKEFSYTNTEWLALAKLADAIFDGWGISKMFSVMKKYRKNHVKIFNAGLLNPANIIRNIEIELKLWREIKNNNN